jgi:hypothetical protein
MVAKSATRLALVSGTRHTPVESCWPAERFGVENAGIDFAKGVLIASGMSLLLWGGLIGALSRLLLK